MIVVSIAEQRLYHLSASFHMLTSYQVSSAALGVGQQMNSYQTPLGLHMVSELYGHNNPVDTVYIGRRETGERYSAALAKAHPDRDWILSRIIRLSGLEMGYNRGGEVDTHMRYIYLHGCPDSSEMGVPLSHGCIRMRNLEVAELFDCITVGDFVYITELPWSIDVQETISVVVKRCTLRSDTL